MGGNYIIVWEFVIESYCMLFCECTIEWLMEMIKGRIFCIYKQMSL